MNLIDLSIRRPIFLCMVTLFFVVVGVLAARSLPVDLYPDVSPPTLTVRVQFSGASPEEVEELVVKPLENVLATMGGVKAMRSTSREGVGQVSLEFEPGRDVRYEETQVRAKVAEARRSLPEDADEPTVRRQSLDEEPILEVVVHGPRSVSELSDIAEHEVATPIRQIEGVGTVTLSGERTREVKIELKPDMLLKFRLNATEVVARLRNAVAQTPAGKLEGSERVWLLRMNPSATTVDELGKIVVTRTPGGVPVFLGEIAHVTEGFNRPIRTNRFFDGKSTQPSVSIEITRQSGQNTLEVAAKITERLNELRHTVPQDVGLTVTNDASTLITRNVLDVVETLIIAAVLTVVVVLLFLQSPRSTLTTAISLPSSIATTFLAMKFAGFTINTMTLLALSLAIGIIVDDAIVVRENVFRHMAELKKNGRQAASEGTKEVAVAVLATTLTLVAVFVPVSDMNSVTGQFFKPFALTVAFSVLVSSWDALTMAPLLSAHYANIPSPELEWARFGKPGLAIYRGLAKVEHGFSRLSQAYEAGLRKLLRLHGFQALVLAISLGSVVWGGLTVKKGFLPAQLGTDFRVVLDGPLSVPPERVATLMPEVESLLAKSDSLATFSLSGGTGFNGNAIVFVSARARPELSKSQESLAAVRQTIRATLSRFPGYNVRVVEVSDPLSGGGGGRFAPVAVNIVGTTLEELSTFAKKVRELMDGTEGLSDVSNLADEGLSEFRIRIDEARAGQVGVSPKLVADNIKTWVQGETAMHLKRGDTQIPVIVSLKDGFRSSPADLLRQSVFTSGPQGVQSVPLASVATLDGAAGPTAISRENRQRTLRIFAGLEPRVALGDAIDRLQNNLATLPLPAGVSVQVTGQGEQMAAFFGELGLAVLLGSVFVYMVLASLFESLIHPLTVMLAIPLAGSGAFLALIAFGVPFDLYGGIGLVLLTGIAAKNSILLVDLALRLCRENPALSPAEAMAQSAPLRLRPILMTSIAMIVGMLPVATGWGVGGATRQALGLAAVGGVISSTFLSLIIIPSFFIWIESSVRFLRGKNAK